MKQETLEEAVKTYYEENIDQSNIPREHYEWEIQDLMLGFAYKWQQEQDKKMYSEEDMHKLMDEYQNWLFNSEDVILTFREWFEKSKNK
jgi:hypothetical protein